MCICQSGRCSAHGLVASSAHGPIASPPRRPGSAHRLARASNQSFADRSLRCATVVSPRGVAFHPLLVEGSLAECKDLREGALREILDSFQACPPVFYLGSTTNFLWRWRESRNQGRSGGQVRPRVQPTALLVGAVGPLPHGVRGPLRRNGGELDRYIQEVRPRTSGLTGSIAKTGRSCEQGALRTRSFSGTHFGDFGNLVPQHGRIVLFLVVFV